MTTHDAPPFRLIFLGAGGFACPALRQVARRPDTELSAIITQPNRPKGRRRQPAPCPAKDQAAHLGLPILTPDILASPEFLARLEGMAPDLFVVVDYGRYLPERLLAVPRMGAINIHPSLLPRYRGAAPIPWAMANGDTETGVSILYVSSRMDAGDILLQEPAIIRPDDTAESLGQRLSEQGALLLDRALDLFPQGRPEGRPQDESAASRAPKLTKEDGRVDWTWPASKIRNRIRAFQPWPGCFTEAPTGSGRNLRLLEALAEPGAGGPPGALLPSDGGAPRVATGDGILRLLAVQPEGRTPMPGQAWACGYVRTPDLTLG